MSRNTAAWDALLTSRGLVALALAASCLAWLKVDDRVLNVVTYTVQQQPLPARALERLAPILAAVIILASTIRLRPPQPGIEDSALNHQMSRTHRATWSPRCSGAALLASFGLAVPLMMCFGGGRADFLIISAAMLAPVLGASLLLRDGDAVRRDELGLPEAAETQPARALPARAAQILLLLAMVAATTWHAWMQVWLWRRFELGYADFGLFTVELEHCLPWKSIGAERFDGTRMGFHCIPMFYLLVPLYAFFRSPVLLMVAGPAALSAAAWPLYALARDRTGSSLAGMSAGLGWLLLPSITRLPYANTYGFQSVDLAVPLVAWSVCAGLRGQWRLSHVMLACAVLCEETVCGVAVGWGVYIACFERRRREGALIVLAAGAWLFLATTLIIPGFDATGRYTRLDLFAAVTPRAAAERLARPRASSYLVALLAPLAVGCVRAPKLLLAAAPTLLLVLLLQNPEYLNIKYWHQASVLPVLAAAGVIGSTRARGAHSAPGRRRCLEGRRGCAVLLAGILLFHHAMGFSPLTRAYRTVGADFDAEATAARREVVEFVRGRFDPDRTHVIATERLAAHFTRYRTVRSTPGVDFSLLPAGLCVLLFDHSDTWDATVQRGETEAFLRRAHEAGLVEVTQRGAVQVLARTTP